MKKILIPLAAVVLASNVSAQPHQPPQEAIDACNNMAEGDACTVETPRGTLEGTCRMPPQVEQLVCVPARGKGGPGPRENDQS
ncbi:hypothetical protein MO867_14620 [Microbulbifer sp. OS29]|uniref:DUF2282 domain-containing protein n=1 Tax=Microbulbifer okhotskensis TaxID=2926617 RepID=A0A9X2EQN6_9GAMM|nr:hypothetical protein [Microbulbifer okhotskensis]MCO1335570.1 hypothetical protein [Microbulbifer okhotskensis]